MSYVPKKSLKKSFTQDVAALLYAHGDVETPDAKSVAVLEDILVNYLTDISQQLLAISNRAHINPKKPMKKIKVEDLCFILRHDKLKLSRAKELIVQQKEIENARKQKDDNVIDQYIEEERKRKAAALEAAEAANGGGSGGGGGSGHKKRKKNDDEDDDEEEDDDDDYDNDDDSS